MGTSMRGVVKFSKLSAYTAFKLPVQIYVKDYADAKFGCVPVAQPKTCHYGGKFWVAQLRHLGFFGLRSSRHRCRYTADALHFGLGPTYQYLA